MANIAFTTYKIEGPEEDLNKIYQICLQCIDDGNNAESDILESLCADNLDNYSLRGEIIFTVKDEILLIEAEESWTITDFSKVLKVLFPDITIYWYVEEPACSIYETNDVSGKYFPAKYCLEYYKNDFIEETYYPESDEELYNVVSRISEKSIKNQGDIEAFNKLHEEENTYFSVHNITII